MKVLGTENISELTNTWHLELIPKTAQSFKSIELWVNKDGMTIQIKFTENNLDSTTVLLSDIQKNISSVTVSEFKL